LPLNKGNKRFFEGYRLLKDWYLEYRIPVFHFFTLGPNESNSKEISDAIKENSTRRVVGRTYRRQFQLEG
jgi:hypothetical protein